MKGDHFEQKKYDLQNCFGLIFFYYLSVYVCVWAAEAGSQARGPPKWAGRAPWS